MARLRPANTECRENPIMTLDLHIRHAVSADVDGIVGLHTASLRALGRSHYSGPQVEAMLRAGTLDLSLVQDGTYFVAEHDGRICGAGGWTANENMAVPGGPAFDLGATPSPLRRAFIRAVYVHPNFARQGIGRQIVKRAERAAAARGFRRIELFSTLSGAALYRELGYRVLSARDFVLPSGGSVSTLHIVKHPALPNPANH